MSHVEPSDPSDVLVAEYLDAHCSGRRADCEALLRRHPEFAPGLLAILDDHDRVDRHFAPLRRLSADTPGSEGARATVRFGDTAVDLPPAGSSFGDYELMTEVARGGMGVVYKARQKSLNRIVALKMMLGGTRDSSLDRERFLVEARAVARLNHTHIVPIHEVGEHAGQPYFTMEFLTGGSLREQIAGLRHDQRAIARMMVSVARAVEHAHRRGILHRDLKPTNVLLDERREPHVADFGLAKRLDEESSLTQAGAIVGTPSYMAPEQAQGHTDLTTAVDVYGLGALMYELLTGRPPFKGGTPLETMMAAVSQPAPRPRRLAPAVNADLETICLKCLEKDPPARYGSADALADDLERWLEGRPIQARPVTAGERLVKWARRQPFVAGAVATLVAAVLGLLVLGGFLWQNAELRAQAVKRLDDAKVELAQVDAQRKEAETKKTEAENLADQQLKLADAQKALADKIAAEVARLEAAAGAAERKLQVAERDARRTIYAADMQLAHAAWQGENVPTASELVGRYRDPAGQEDVRGFEWHYLNRQINSARLSWRPRPSDELKFDAILGLTVSPDNKLLATAQPGNEVKLWSLADGGLVRTVSAVARDAKGVLQTNVTGVFFSDDGKRLMAVSRKDVDMADITRLVGEAMVGTGKLQLASVTGAFEFRSWALGDETPARVEPFDPRRLATPVSLVLAGGAFAVDGGFGLSVTAMDRSPDGKSLAVAAIETDYAKFGRGGFTQPGVLQGGRLIIWDLENGQVRAQQKSPAILTIVAFSPGGDALAIATSDGAVGVGKPDLAQPPRLMPGHRGFVNSLRFSADGKRLASGGLDGLAIVWDVAATSEAARLRGHTTSVTWVEFSPDGQSLIAGSGDGVVKVWDLERTSEPLVLRGHGGSVPALAFAAGGAALVSVETNGSAKTWSAADGKLLRETPAPKAPTQGVVTLSARGGILTWPSWNLGDNRIVIRKLADDEERQIPWKERAPLQSAISADERLLASVDHQSGRVSLWDIQEAKLLKELEGERFVPGLVFSHDGKRLAARGMGVTLWDLEAGTSRRLLDTRPATSAVAFSPDDTQIAVAVGSIVRIHDVASGQPGVECRGAGKAIMHLAFSADARRLATAGITAGQRGALKLWDTSNGREVLSASLPPVTITAIAFSPDGHRLAAALTRLDPTASTAGRKVPGEIHIWDATPTVGHDEK